MAVFMITCELRNNKNLNLINEQIGKLGDCIRPLSSFWLVSTEMGFNELYNHINALVDRNDMFYITSISSVGIGRLDMEDTNWIKKKFFIPVTPIAPTGNTKGPFPVQQPAPASYRPAFPGQRLTPPGQRPSVSGQRPAAASQKPASSTVRQWYPEMPWD